MDRNHNKYGTPKIPANRSLENSDSEQGKHAPVVLDAHQRGVVERAVREVSEYRGYGLRAINVRTNHVHAVVSAMKKPEPVLNALKSYSTRALRTAGLLESAVKPWARHGSTIYLWKEQDVARAIAYVLLSQGDELFSLDD